MGGEGPRGGRDVDPAFPQGYLHNSGIADEAQLMRSRVLNADKSVGYYLGWVHEECVDDVCATTTVKLRRWGLQRWE